MHQALNARDKRRIAQEAKLLTWLRAHYAVGDTIIFSQHVWDELERQSIFTVHREVNSLLDRGYLVNVGGDGYALTEEGKHNALSSLL